MWDADLKVMQARYSTRYAEFGIDRRSLGWEKDCQSARFRAVLDCLTPNDYGTVLDVGCGFGDLLTFLRQSGWGGSYIGIDLVPEMLREAEHLHEHDSHAQFESIDITKQQQEPRADLVVSVGIFNHKLQQPQHEYVQEMIHAMWNLSSHAVVCDFLSTSSDPSLQRADLYYAEPHDLTTIGRAYTRRLMLHHAYMPFEFQLKLWHDDNYTVTLPVFKPYIEPAG